MAEEHCCDFLRFLPRINIFLWFESGASFCSNLHVKNMKRHMSILNGPVHSIACAVKPSVLVVRHF